MGVIGGLDLHPGGAFRVADEWPERGTRLAQSCHMLLALVSAVLACESENTEQLAILGWTLDGEAVAYAAWEHVERPDVVAARIELWNVRQRHAVARRAFSFVPAVVCPEHPPSDGVLGTACDPRLDDNWPALTAALPHAWLAARSVFVDRAVTLPREGTGLAGAWSVVVAPSMDQATPAARRSVLSVRHAGRRLLHRVAVESTDTPVGDYVVDADAQHRDDGSPWRGASRQASVAPDGRTLALVTHRIVHDGAYCHDASGDQLDVVVDAHAQPGPHE